MKIKFYDFSQIERMSASCCNHRMDVVVHLDGFVCSMEVSFESDKEQVWLEGPDPSDLFKVPMGPGNLVCQSINGWKLEMLKKEAHYPGGVEQKQYDDIEQELDESLDDDLRSEEWLGETNPQSSNFNPFKYQEEQESGRHQRIAEMIEQELDDPTEYCPVCQTMYDPDGVCPKCPSPIQV